jgi:hypothetical protein
MTEVVDMKGNVISLSEKRIEVDCRALGVADCLRTVLKHIEDGTIDPLMVYVALETSDSEDDDAYPFYQAGGNTLEMAGLLTLHQLSFLRRAIGGDS